MMSFCAVIPAAGRGSRLGADCPKILVEVAPQKSIWSVLSANLFPFVDALSIVVSPSGRPLFEKALTNLPPEKQTMVALQESPLGMGHAIFCAYDQWKNFDNILVVWGDQVHVSKQTFSACKSIHLNHKSSGITLPVVALDTPYVEYQFDEQGRLTEILQSREGDICHAGGLGDVGVFLLSTKGLFEAWQDYLQQLTMGAKTGEINFLPFLVYLSCTKKWPISRVQVENPDEARGINTQEDLAYFNALYKS